jgi:tetratricopeptide (TPR) repeat protein
MELADKTDVWQRLVESHKPKPLSEPPLTSAELTENQAFWRDATETSIRPVVQLVSQPELPRPAFEKRLMKLGRLQTPLPTQTKLLARWYSGALNRWGVTLQQNARLSEATPCFTLAQDLNPDNLPARVNLQCNSNLLAGQTMTVNHAPLSVDQFDGRRNLFQVLTEDGIFDEPSYCYRIGLVFADDMPCQACQQLERANALAPGDFPARLLLGKIYSNGLRPIRALQIAAEIQADPGLRPLGLTNEVEVALMEARAWFSLTNYTRARGTVYALVDTYPGNDFVFERCVGTLIASQSYLDARKITDRRLALTPNALPALTAKVDLCFQAGDYSNAIPALTRSLSLTNTMGARLIRAFAYVQTGRLDAAEADYQELLQTFPTAYRAYGGLAEIALRKQDTNGAIRYYEQYLSKAEAETGEAKAVAARLRSLRQSRH